MAANMVGVRDEAIDLLSKALGWALLAATFGPLLFLIVRSIVAGRPEYD